MPNGQVGQDKKKITFEEIPEDSQETGVTFEEIAGPPSVSSVEGPAEVPFLEELGVLDPEILRTISQAQATFAPEATFAFTGALMAPVRNILTKPGVITLDDIFSDEIKPLMPIASSELGIGPVAAIMAKSGIIPGVIRGAVNMTRALAARPAETVLGLVTAPAIITYQALRSFAATHPGDPGALREKFIELTGEMSPEEAQEAHRAFSGLLASAAVGMGLFRVLGRPSFQVARQLGADKATALKQAKLIRAKVTGVSALGVFGAVGGEPTEMEKNFVMFALASIPLGLTFHAFKAIGKADLSKPSDPVRAVEYQEQRAARPFNQETTPIPEVRITRDRPTEIPLGEEIKPREEAVPELQATREAVQEQVGRVLDRENIFLEESVEAGPKKAEPLVPDVLAIRLNNYVQHEGNAAKIIIQNLETEPSKMVVVPGTETPARALEFAREIEGKDAIVAVHLLPDGRFDIAVGRKGSPLDNPLNFKQFTEEGYFAGQKISVNGENLIYIGKSGEQSFVRVPGDPRLIKIDTKDIRRPKDVSVRDSSKPEVTPEKQLEGVLEPGEIEVYKALREEVHPLEPSTEAKTFDQIRQEASTNGLELTRTASNTFIVRDRATGQELFKGATKEEAEAFINKSGQDGTVVFDGNIPVDTDIPGNVMPPPPPGLRVNEPFDFPPNTKVGTIVDLFQSLTPFIAPFKDWSTATDNILGTRIFSEVYLRTQEPAGRSLARAVPKLRELQKIEKIAKDTKLSESDMEMVFDYIETRSPADLRGSHLKGLGPLKSRSMTADELASVDLLLELDVETQRLYEYIRMREQLLWAEAQNLKTNVKNLDPRIKRAIEAELIDSKNMTPNEMAGVQIFDHIRAQDLNDISLYVVSRLVEAERGGALSQVDFAAKNNMSAAQIKVANEIVRLQDEIAAIPDIPIDDAQLIRGYMAHYGQHQTASPEGSVLNQGGVSRDMSFVNSMIRSGETNVYDRNPISVTARYIKNAFNSVEFNTAWNDAKKYVDTELGGQFGREGSVASWVARSYLSDLRGVPGASTKFTQQVVDAFFKKMGWKMQLNIRQDLVNTYLAMTNAAFMGARPGLAMRDLMQLSIFHYSRFGGVGGTRTMRALTLATKLGQEGTKQLRDAGELPTIGIVEFETALQLEASAIGRTMKGLPAMTRRVAEVGLTLSGQRNAYEFGYKGILLEARETALREITNLVDGSITKEQAYKRIGLDTYNLQTKKAFDAFVTSGEYERAADFLGQQTAREIMGVYGRANHPWGWGTNLGRLASHYGTWSSNALAFTLGGMSRGSKAQRLAFATRFGMTQAALQGAGSAVGLNVHSWLVLPGLFFTGGPAVQTADLIITALTGYGRDKDAAKKRLMRLLPASNDPRSMFIPGSYVVGDWMQAIENADNPIEFFGRGFSIPLMRGRSWMDNF